MEKKLELLVTCLFCSQRASPSSLSSRSHQLLLKCLELFLTSKQVFKVTTNFLSLHFYGQFCWSLVLLYPLYQSRNNGLYKASFSKKQFHFTALKTLGLEKLLDYSVLIFSPSDWSLVHWHVPLKKPRQVIIARFSSIVFLDHFREWSSTSGGSSKQQSENSVTPTSSTWSSSRKSFRSSEAQTNDVRTFLFRRCLGNWSSVWWMLSVW